MNYLAHFYLAHDDEGLIVGNFVADYAPGKKYMEFPEHVQKGVELHRAIDSFTDSHPSVNKTKARLREKYRKYAPVITDVFYDYALGSQWNRYSDLELKTFTQEIYDVLRKNTSILPEPAQITLGYMSMHDWLYHYSSYFGIEKALGGLSRRAKYESLMDEAIHDLKEHESAIIDEFNEFFEPLQAFVAQKKSE